jgi:hypothetical protein
MDYYSFLEWINFRIQNDSKYNETEDFYGILLLFPKGLSIIYNNVYKTNNFLSFLKPIYPWSIEWLNLFKNNLNKIFLLEQKIKAYEEMIKKK